MFSDKLFQHKYDIDDIIKAMLSSKDGISQLFQLNTKNGSIEEISKPFKNTKNTFLITPLDKSFLNELANDKELLLMQQSLKNEIMSILRSLSSNEDLYKQITTTKSQASGWLFKKTKEKALKFLGENQIIPPSMLNNFSCISTPISHKVNIKLED